MALGCPGRQVWPEMWYIIGPMLDQVNLHAQATWSADQMLPLQRNGYVEEAYLPSPKVPSGMRAAASAAYSPQ
jgi:hypothetical protein